MTLASSYSVLLALLAALTAGFVGGFALMRRMSLAGDAISHIALPGIGLALLLKVNPLIGAAATLLLGALLIWRIETSTGLDPQTVIGVVFSASLALGALLTPSKDMMEALFGGFPMPSTLEFVAASTLTFAILAALWHWRDGLVINLFSPDLAAVAGLKRSRLDLVFALIFAMTVLIVLRFLGALLAGALIIIPAAVARQWTSRLSPFLAISATVSIASVAGGLALAARSHVSQGPAVVAVASAAFIVSFFARQPGA